MKPTIQDAETLAISGLAFLAGDPERLQQFLSLSGLQAHDIRSAAQQEGFLVGVLDHLLSDDNLLLAFAHQGGIDPASIEKARHSLGGPREFYEP